MRRFLIFSALLLFSIASMAQPKINGFEYWFDRDYQGRTMTPVASSSAISFSDSISVIGLNTGLHILNFRFRQDNGLWTSLSSKFFILPPLAVSAQQKKLVAYEYWLNKDFGSRATQVFASQSPYLFLDSISITHLPEGLNTLSFRMKDDEGLWSSPRQHFFVKSTGSMVFLQKDLTHAEYWFNDEYAKKTTIAIQKQNSFSLMDSLNIGHLEGNPNVLHYRFRDSDNLWTPLVSRMFLIRDDIQLRKVYDIVAYRYWLTGWQSKTKEQVIATSLPRVIIIDSLDLRYANTGQYILNVQVKDRSGRWSSTISDTIDRDFSPYVSFEASDTLVCTGERITFSFDTADVNQLIWDYGFGNPDTTLSPGVVYSQPGIYTVSVLATNTDSNVSISRTRRAYIEVSPSYDSTQYSIICEDDSLLFNGKWHYADSIYSYVYSTKAGCDSILRLNLDVLRIVRDSVSRLICQGQTFSFGMQSLSTAGIYNETFVGANGCDSLVELDLGVTGVDTSVSPSRTSLQALASNATFQWLDCNMGYQIIAGATSASFSPTMNGSYAVQVSQNGCVDTSDCYVLNSIGVQESLFRQLVEVYPNPAESFIILKFKERGSHTATRINLLDARGRIVKTILPTGLSTTIQIEELSAGPYLLELRNPQFHVIGRLLKQ